MIVRRLTFACSTVQSPNHGIRRHGLVIAGAAPLVSSRHGLVIAGAAPTVSRKRYIY